MLHGLYVWSVWCVCMIPTWLNQHSGLLETIFGWPVRIKARSVLSQVKAKVRHARWHGMIPIYCLHDMSFTMHWYHIMTVSATPHDHTLQFRIRVWMAAYWLQGISHVWFPSFFYQLQTKLFKSVHSAYICCICVSMYVCMHACHDWWPWSPYCYECMHGFGKCASLIRHVHTDVFYSK